METLPVESAQARLLRLPEVLARTEISKSTLYRLIRRSEFPRPLELSIQARRWPEDAIEDWLADKRARAAN